MVKKKSCGSKGMQCLGVLATGAKCDRARDGSGRPVFLNKLCPDCKEQRCRKHCKTGREKTAKGRSVPRGKGQESKVKIKVSVAATAPAAASLPGPVGRAPAASCLLLDVDAFYSRCCADVATASEVEVASYQYDNPSLQKVLMKRLKGRPAFTLRVYLDAEMFEGDVPRYQKARVRELWQAGAQVFLCRGPRSQGSFHVKAVVVDRRYLYCGSPNFTYKSHNNAELCWRMTGPNVGQVLQKLVVESQKRKLWDGS
jgi:hypothetical protein